MNIKITNKRLQAAMACTLVALTAGSAFGQTPVVYYNFNETVGSTTLTDGNLDGGDSFNATYRDTENLPTYGAGLMQGAWQGNGGDLDSFLTEDLTVLNGFVDLAISVWVKPAASPGFDGIFVAREVQADKGGTNVGINQQGNQIDARTGGAVLDTPNGSVPVGEWTHVALTVNSFTGISTVYLNGEVSATNGPGGDTDDLDRSWITGGPWSVGDDPCCGGREWAGLMDDLAVFNSVLSDEDVMGIYQNGLNGIAINGDVNPLPGDVDRDNDVDNDDLDPILMNFLDTVSGEGVDTRVLGDLSNDGFVGLADFREWKDHFPTNGAINGVGVPEPSTWILVFLGAMLAALKSRRRVVTVAPAIALLTLVMQAPEIATAQVVVTIDQDTGSVTAANTGQDEILFDGYEIRSNNDLLDSAAWSNFETVQGLPGWRVLETPNANRFGEGFITTGEFATFATDPAFDFGAVFSLPALYQAQLDVGFGNEARDVSFGYLEPGNSVLTQATVEYVGETVTNNLILKVASDGTAVMENESPFAFSIDGFAIQSAAGSLNDSWTGSPDLAGPDWVLASTDSDGLGQVSPLSEEPIDGAVGGVVQPGGRINMGDIFVVGSPEDLEFRFLRVGEDDGDGFLGVVEYLVENELGPGDYNGNGRVEQGDLDLVLLNWGADWPPEVPGWVNDQPTDNSINQNDLDGVLLNWGNGAAAVAVPEPVSASLLLVAVVGVITRRRR